MIKKILEFLKEKEDTTVEEKNVISAFEKLHNGIPLSEEEKIIIDEIRTEIARYKIQFPLNFKSIVKEKFRKTYLEAAAKYEGREKYEELTGIVIGKSDLPKLRIVTPTEEEQMALARFEEKKRLKEEKKRREEERVLLKNKTLTEWLENPAEKLLNATVEEIEIIENYKKELAKKEEQEKLNKLKQEIEPIKNEVIKILAKQNRSLNKWKKNPVVKMLNTTEEEQKILEKYIDALDFLHPNLKYKEKVAANEILEEENRRRIEEENRLIQEIESIKNEVIKILAKQNRSLNKWKKNPVVKMLNTTEEEQKILGEYIDALDFLYPNLKYKEKVAANEILEEEKRRIIEEKNRLIQENKKITALFDEINRLDKEATILESTKVEKGKGIEKSSKIFAIRKEIKRLKETGGTELAKLFAEQKKRIIEEEIKIEAKIIREKYEKSIAALQIEENRKREAKLAEERQRILDEIEENKRKLEESKKKTGSFNYDIGANNTVLMPTIKGLTVLDKIEIKEQSGPDFYQRLVSRKKEEEENRKIKKTRKSTTERKQRQEEWQQRIAIKAERARKREEKKLEAIRIMEDWHNIPDIMILKATPLEQKVLANYFRVEEKKKKIAKTVRKEKLAEKIAMIAEEERIKEEELKRIAEEKRLKKEAEAQDAKRIRREKQAKRIEAKRIRKEKLAEERQRILDKIEENRRKLEVEKIEIEEIHTLYDEINRLDKEATILESTKVEKGKGPEKNRKIIAIRQEIKRLKEIGGTELAKLFAEQKKRITEEKIKIEAKKIREKYEKSMAALQIEENRKREAKLAEERRLKKEKEDLAQLEYIKKLVLQTEENRIKEEELAEERRLRKEEENLAQLEYIEQLILQTEEKKRIRREEIKDAKNAIEARLAEAKRLNKLYVEAEKQLFQEEKPIKLSKNATRIKRREDKKRIVKEWKANPNIELTASIYELMLLNEYFASQEQSKLDKIKQYENRYYFGSSRINGFNNKYKYYK